MGTQGAGPAGDGNGDREGHGPVTTRTAGGSEGIDGWSAEDDARARSILQYAAEVVEVRAGDGSLRYVSPTVTAVLGYEPGALLGRPALALVHEDDREALERALTGVRSRPGGHTDLQYRVRHFDGSWRWFESRIANLLDDPAVGGIVTYSWDETERRRAIDEGARSREALRNGEARFSSLVQHASDFVIVSDGQGRITYLSPSTERFLGKRLDVGELALQRELLHPDDVETVAGVFEEMLAGRAVARSIECRVLDLEGRYRWMEATLTNLLDDAAVAGVVVNARDVTESREAGQALRESEERFRALVEYSSDIISVLDADGTWRTSSSGGTRLLGWPKGIEPEGGIFSLVHPDDRERAVTAFEELVDGRRNPEDPVVVRVATTDGGYRHLETVGQDLRDHPAIRGLVLNSRDVTERVEAEEALHRRRALEGLAATISGRFVDLPDTDQDRGIDEALRDVGMFAGVDRSSVFLLSDDGATMSNTHEWCAEGIEPRIEALQDLPVDAFPWSMDRLRRGEPIHVPVVADLTGEAHAERQILEAQGSRSVLVVPVSSGDRLRGFVGFDSVQAEKVWPDDAVTLLRSVAQALLGALARRDVNVALRESEERFRALVQNATDIVALVDADGTLMYASPAAEHLLGYPDGSMVGTNVFELLHPEDVAIASEQLAEVVREPGAQRQLEQRVKHADGSWRHMEIKGVNRLDDPAVGGIVLNARDITDRRAAEDSLRRSEARFRALVQNSSDMVTVIDQDGVFTYASESVERVLGHPSHALVGHSAFEIVHPDDRETAIGSLARAFDEPDWIELVEVRVAHADGSWRDVELLGANLLDDPAVRGLVVNARDVTERKEAERAVSESEERFRALAQHASDMITVLGPDGKVLYSSPSAGRLMGYGQDWGLGDEHWDLVHPDDIDEVARVFAEAMSSPGVGPRLVLRVRHSDGSWRWLEALSNNLLDEPAVGGVVITARDVTEQVEAAEALRESEALVAEQARILEMIAQGSPLPDVVAEACLVVERHAPGVLCSVLLLDDDGATLRHGAAPSLPDSFVGVVAAGVPVAPTAGSCGAAAYRREPVVSADLATDPLWADWRELALSHGLRAAWSTPIMSSGHERVLGTFAIYYTEPRSPSPEHEHIVDLVVHLASIAIERKDSEERLAHQAHHDSLTGLPNRMLFLEFLEVALARARRADSRLAVLFLDLDRFKVVNDSLGHDAGDELLMALGSRLREVVRPGDTVARFGGDEFVVLCEDVSADDAHRQALEVADRLLQAVTQPFVLDGDEHFLSASIGVAIGPRDGEQPDELLRDADAAMYRAKERGKGRSELFDEAMRASARDRLETENALHRALERGEFRLVYQPIIELSDGRCVGAEALLRWEHPERGLLAPRDFVERAEESGLIVPIGAWVLEEAARQASRWVDVRGGDPFVVSVNLSARQLAHRETPDRVAAALESSGIDPAGLCLEITESVLMGEGSMAAVEALHALGVSLSIDDFGTGYSSLGYLKRFPVDAVKVDRAFVDGLGTDPEDSAIVTAVVSLGHALDLTVVAEGVETRAQLDELVTLGCDQAQGYLFARPQPAADLDDLVVGRLAATGTG